MEEQVKDPGPSFLKAAGVISALTMGSRVLGLVREQVFAAFLGAGAYADAFQVAFRIPNLLRDLFAEGALSAAFVPTYTRALDGRRPGAGPPARLPPPDRAGGDPGRRSSLLGFVFARPGRGVPRPRLRPRARSS